MKKTLLTGCLVINIFYSAFAQPQPWAQTGAEWYYTFWTFTFSGYIKYEKMSDTLINGVNCDKYKSTLYGYDYTLSQYTSNITYEYAYFSNDTVYRLYNSQFITMYKYNPNVGDSWFVPDNGTCGSNGYYSVDSVSTTLINSDTLQIIYISAFNSTQFIENTTILERIGSTSNLFPLLYCQLDNPVTELRCYSDKEFTYITNVVPYCDYTTGIDTQSETDISINIFPNPARELITVKLNSIVQSRSEKIPTMTIENEIGKVIANYSLNEIDMSIDISSLRNGYYTIRINANKNIYYHKLIKIE